MSPNGMIVKDLGYFFSNFFISLVFLEDGPWIILVLILDLDLISCSINNSVRLFSSNPPNVTKSSYFFLIFLIFENLLSNIWYFGPKQRTLPSLREILWFLKPINPFTTRSAEYLNFFRSVIRIVLVYFFICLRYSFFTL